MKTLRADKKRGSKSKGTADADLLLILTGRRRRDRYRADILGTAVWLPLASFEALVELVCAAVCTETGLVALSRRTVYRLRKYMAASARTVEGQQLIETGDGEEYRIAIPKSAIRKSIGIAPCFFELADRRLVTAEQARLLEKHCRNCRIGD